MLNLEIQTPESTLPRRAMLVHLGISQWSARKLDKRASSDVAARHGATGTAGNFNKSLLPRESLARLSTIVTQARAEHIRLSLPWLQDGTRVIPVTIFDQYAAAMSRFRETFEHEAELFCAAYADHMDAARAQLGTLFNPADYPPVEDIRRRFSWRITALPMPDSGDFRVDLDESTAAALRADIESSVANAMRDATRDIFTRLHTVVQAMAEKLSAYDPTKGKQGSPFRDSLVQNLRDVVEILPALNLAQDANLSSMIDRARDELAPHDAKALREDDSLREGVAAKAADIADAMAGWM